MSSFLAVVHPRARPSGRPAPKEGAATLQAAAHWLAIGLPVRSIRVVIKDRAAADSFARVFSDFKAGLRDWLVRPPTEARYDFFISYAHEDTEAAETLVRALHQVNPDLRIFLGPGEPRGRQHLAARDLPRSRCQQGRHRDVDPELPQIPLLRGGVQHRPDPQAQRGA